MKTKETPTNRWTDGQRSAPEKKNFKEKKADERRKLIEDAIVKIGLDVHDVFTAPQISEVLKVAKGGVPTIINSMRFSNEPCIRQFLSAYDEASDLDKRIIPFEAFALLAKVDIPQLLGAIILSLRDQGANIVKIMLMTHHEDTVKARIRNAKKPGGVRDRNALDTALGLLPSPKGPTIFNVMPGVRQLSDRDSPMIEAGEIDANEMFPNLSKTQNLLTGTKE